MKQQQEERVRYAPLTLLPLLLLLLICFNEFIVRLLGCLFVCLFACNASGRSNTYSNSNSNSYSYIKEENVPQNEPTFRYLTLLSTYLLPCNGNIRMYLHTLNACACMSLCVCKIKKMCVICIGRVCLRMFCARICICWNEKSSVTRYFTVIPE